MNQELIKFIELCLSDGIISDKEKEVIFRKSNELGVPLDECEIIIKGLTDEKKIKEEETNNEVQIQESYSDETYEKQWFLNWLKTKNEIINKRKNLNSILQEFVLTKIDGSEGMGSVDGNAIQKQTLLKICELEELASKPSSFFSSGKKGKKGSLENKFKIIINNAIEEEGYATYFTSTFVRVSGSIENFCFWNDSDLNEMIENHNNTEKKFTGRWYSLRNNPTTMFGTRESVLITQKSIYEFSVPKKTIDNNSQLLTRFEELELRKTDIKKLDLSFFKDEFNSFRTIYKPIEKLFSNDSMSINDLIPKRIIYKNEKFIDVLNKIGLNDQLSRIINIDEKIKEFIQTNYNSKLKKLKEKKQFMIGFKSKEDVIGRESIVIQENPIVNTIYDLSIEFFNIFLKLLNFRDSLINLHLENKIVELEGLLNKFENSTFGMTRFEKNTLKTLNELNDNLIEIKETTINSLQEVNDKLGIVIENLDSINNNTEEIIRGISFNNFVSVVNLYQNYKVNKKVNALHKP
tara:strand:+ start:172 stop:1731 length:1560 start_codon:yes stop_codon:yes gene_type:complete